MSRLLQRAGTGDRRAFAQAYDATAARAFGLCRRVLGDDETAAEATEVAFREVWRRASSYDPVASSAAAWVLAIVHRTAVTQARERGTAVPAQAPPAVGCSADAVLAALTTVEWAALDLTYFGARLHAEVADLLGLAPAVAPARIRDGLLHVRALMPAG